MSTREKLKRDIDFVPDESLAKVSALVNSIIKSTSKTKKEEDDEREKAYRTIQSIIRKVEPPIDYEKERQEYLDEKYGSIY
jgi:ribosome-binding ATPase YchF (GTP1/OBG family)